MPNPRTAVKTTAVPKSHKEVELKSVTFSELWKNYAHGNPYDDPNGQYKNQCAIRMSVTLHKVGIAMKSFSQKQVRPMPGKPTLGRLLIDDKPTATRAYEFAEWLKLRPVAGVLAPENITGPNWASKVSGRTGIIFFDGYWLQDGDSPDNLSGGHVDLWNGNKLTGFGSGVRISWNIVLPGIWSDFRNSKTILFFPVK
ncbi:hypothetical protein DIE03_12710 [Burkholderia sp. Bp8992]|uniref:type VI secretion system amidase effector protein Tae4 n=1 Tax=unclassified Burkholderia TaxID=2613784 RepID=UPI000F5853E2|nr:MULTISPECIES: type VI secretion system amidase effector protein Tae4 [unclassified Burkholderia]RQS31552.1 hypothetical protein DIE03_12710 [Burkholderia sp. Bp8992]